MYITDYRYRSKYMVYLHGCSQQGQMFISCHSNIHMLLITEMGVAGCVIFSNMKTEEHIIINFTPFPLYSYLIGKKSYLLFAEHAAL